jgi:hypothetical protein
METPITDIQSRKSEPNTDIQSNGDLENALIDGDKQEPIEVNEEYWEKKQMASLRRYSENKFG